METVAARFLEPFAATVKDKEENVTRQEANQARELGTDPKSGKPVAVRMGRYGPYVIIGTVEDEEKPKFYGLRAGQRMDSITLEEALELTKLPRELGEMDDGTPLSVSIGRFGPYVKYDKKFASLGKEDDPYTITLERAIELVEAKKKADAEKEIQIFPDSDIKVLNGRYGPYVTDGKKNARIPKETDPKSLSFEQCQELIEAAPAKRGRRGAKSKNPLNRTACCLDPGISLIQQALPGRNNSEDPGALLVRQCRGMTMADCHGHRYAIRYFLSRFRREIRAD